VDREDREARAGQAGRAVQCEDRSFVISGRTTTIANSATVASSCIRFRSREMISLPDVLLVGIFHHQADPDAVSLLVKISRHAVLGCPPAEMVGIVP